MNITGKNILNKSNLPSFRQQKEIPTQDKSIIIKDNGEDIILTINKNFASSITSFELQNNLMIALSPLFLNKNKNIPFKKINNANAKKIKEIFPNIGFFIENKGHYTGGRYSLWHQAILLSYYTKVTIVTNQMPGFRSDFKKYENNNLDIIIDETYLTKNISNNIIDNKTKDYENKFSLIIGSPINAGQCAINYGMNFNIPVYLYLFESPNWVKEFRDGSDADEDFWSSYKNALIKADKILVPSNESRKWLQSWDDSFKKKEINVVYPCINQSVAEKILKDDKIPGSNKKNKFDIVFATRLVGFKTPIPIFKKLPKDKYRLHIIGKVWEIELKAIESFIKQGYDIIVHGSVSDSEKYKIIKSADCLIHPSNFEGFGMPPMEGLFFDKQVIVYNLPVLKEIYKDSLHYVDKGDVEKFVKKIREVCEEGNKIEIKESIKRQALHNYTCTHLLDAIGIPKIATGTIVYNGEDYLEYAIESIKQFVHQIIIVEGCVKGYSDKPISTDGTYEIIKKLKEKDFVGKIIFIKNNNKFWNDKISMQNKIAKEIQSDYYVKLDHDEIWKPATLLKVISLFMIDEKLTLMRMPFYHFWINFNTIAVDAGGKWSTNHPRVWRWNKDFHHNNSFNYFSDKNNIKVGAPNYKEDIYAGDCIYHFGYVRRLKNIKEKINYYFNRGIEKYVKDTYSNYKNNSDPTQPTQRVRSWAAKFEGTLPAVLTNHPYHEIKDIREI